MLNDIDRARDALHFLDAGCDRETWHTIGRAGVAAGLTVDDLDTWSATGDNYAGTRDVQAAFRTIKPVGGTGAGTLFRLARDAGWTDNSTEPQRQAPAKAKQVEQPRKPAPGMAAADVWGRCEAATNQHGYIAAKGAAGVPLDALRVVPAGDSLRIAGQSMAGFLMVPAYAPDGEIQSAQFIPPPGAGKKVNLPGASMAGATFTVGPNDGPAHLCEGIGAAWAVWQATGHRAVCCFGWGNVRRVAEAMRESDPSARLVLVPDTGKEADAEKIARDVGAAVAAMPPGWPDNSDVGDLARAEGGDALALLLEAATEPPKPAPRYKLLGSADLAALPPLKWRVRGVLPADGLAGLYGPSASGKSFLALDMAAAIAEGSRWFDCRVEAAPVVYAALEGEAGFKLRAQAWEAHKGRALPAGLQMMMQPFKLTDLRDINDLAAVVPAGAVVFLDTLNRAAPTADENSSKDMGEILEGAKRLQSLIGGLVVLVHHTGKDTTKGLRGHSSLFAAMDAAVEVSRDGDRREWKVAKAKDGEDGDARPFMLQVETLGTDEYGDPVTSCTVQADTRADDIKRVKLPQGGNQRLVYEGIRGLFKDGAIGKPGAPPLRPCIELEAAVAAGAARLTCPSDKKTSRARDAITGLVSRGVLGLNEGFLWTA
jgi:hypothetical protein